MESLRVKPVSQLNKNDYVVDCVDAMEMYKRRMYPKRRLLLSDEHARFASDVGLCFICGTKTVRTPNDVCMICNKEFPIKK